MNSPTPDCSDLRAVFINCTVKKSPELSHTHGLMDRSIALMRRLGVTGERFGFDANPEYR